MVMDTPEKTTQINSSHSKVEESPVFNYINTLSPIKPMKSVHVSQTFHSLSFSALPSIFTSPHVSSNKESRFLRRNDCADASKAEVSSREANDCCSGEVVVDAGLPHDGPSQLGEHVDSGMPLEAATVQSPHESTAVEISTTLKYDFGGPNCDPPPTCATQKLALASAETLAHLMPSVKETSQMDLLVGDVDLQGLCQTEQRKEAAASDWEDFVFDASDLLIFHSPLETEAFKGLPPKPHYGADSCNSLNEEQKMQIVTFVGSSEQTEEGYPSTQSGGTIQPQEITQMQITLASDNLTNKCLARLPQGKVDDDIKSSALLDCKDVSKLHRGVRRRCLDFEMIGLHRNNLVEGSSTSSHVLVQSDEQIISDDKKLVPAKTGTDSARCFLPGIGLYLNALAVTSEDCKSIKHEEMFSNFPGSAPPLHSPTTGQENDKSLTLADNERDINGSTNDDLHVEDSSQPCAYAATEEPNQSSPKKKRRKLEGDNETCKRCNCKKSKCLKLYCECFAAGVYCIEPCSCQDCFNKPIHEDTVLATRRQIESRNPLAFAPKVIRSSESITEIGDDLSKTTPASARHKRGCNCKKSNCLKKYCECFQGGVGCSIGCRCEGCKNTFGKKDGSAPVETETEPENGAEAGEKSGIAEASQKTENQGEEDQNPNPAVPATPSPFCRTLVPLPFSSKCKPPRSLLTIGSSSGLHVGQMYGKPNTIRSQSKFEKQLQTGPDDDIPEILRNCCSPTTGVKTLSPNSKRVSPPQSNFGSSPGLRSGRKLILQSIPSFPSLTPQR